MNDNLMRSRSGFGFRISSFSVILIMVVLSVIGGFVAPLLNVQYAPSSSRNNIGVSFSYNGASARVVEQEVTSCLEGALNTIDGLDQISAQSGFSGGYITLSFKESKAIDVARFEVATQIRQIYASLPSGVSYPYINLASSGGDAKHILSYTINADMPSMAIYEYAQDHFISELSKIEGVDNSSLSGASPFYWEILYDPNMLRSFGITVDDISSAFKTNFADDVIGQANIDDRRMSLTLRIQPQQEVLDIPVKQIQGRVIYLRDLATVSYKEQLPSVYNRINGLNTINLTIYGNDQINTLTVAREVRETMDRLALECPENLTFSITYDASVGIEQEISKIFFRSVLSLLILLVFVLLVSRSFRYLAVIFISIAVNLLIAMIFYYLLDLQIEIYSMAGITISLGIIIDTSIVMVDHYTYYHNRGVLGSVTGALLTTVASLSLIFFLPKQMSDQFSDFVLVIIINLVVSLLVASLFIPSLLSEVSLSRGGVSRSSIGLKRRLVRISIYYGRYICWARAHRWIFIWVMILGFGLPIHLLPEKLGQGSGNTPVSLEDLTPWQRTYNDIIGSSWYSENREIFECCLGGAFRLFTQNLNSASYYRQPTIRKELSIRASMPEGCTVAQLNEVVKSMENYLSGFPQIDMYRTDIRDASSGTLLVTFKGEFENSSFPLQLKQQVISKAASLGGATWAVTGLDDNNFHNQIYNSYKQHGITLTGYNYDVLYQFAQSLMGELQQNMRVSDPMITGSRNSGAPRSEFYIEYDKARIAQNGLDVNGYFKFLTQQLYDNSLGRYYRDGQMVEYHLRSSEKDSFDLWHITYDMIDIDSTATRLADVGTIEKRASGNNIYRQNQQYTLSVVFDFTGSYEMAQRVKERIVEKYNDEILPIGYKAVVDGRGWWGTAEQTQQVFLIFLVMVIIYAICSMIFESLRIPFVIILMIPVSLIGLFLTFALGEFTFDQGGFASVIMLCGIVVNAAIYIVSEYRTVRSSSFKSALRCYITAFNRKIIPTLLTIISTVLGLIPFLFDGTDEVFWFAFAIGVIGGMLFSILTLVFIMPVFMPLRKR
ncbi:MAG: efflux RND transporter permease subunit [Rikenellaceae bacterium]